MHAIIPHILNDAAYFKEKWTRKWHKISGPEILSSACNGGDTQAHLDRRKPFSGWGCSECAWVFNSSGSPTGNSFDELVRNFELQRDKAFTSHVCAEHRRAKTQKD